MSSRQTVLERKSRETEIKCELNVDGTGKTKIKTHIGILDHMLDLFAFHGYFNLNLDVMKADTEIDIHHTNEDVGIVLGKAFKKALGEKTGIRRFGVGLSPMEYTLGRTVIDITGRGKKSKHGLERFAFVFVQKRRRFPLLNILLHTNFRRQPVVGIAGIVRFPGEQVLHGIQLDDIGIFAVNNPAFVNIDSLAGFR
jgi:hypothetical protein